MSLMVTDLTGTAVKAEICKCGKVPFAHATITLDDSFKVEPILSRASAKKVVDGLIIGGVLEEEERKEVVKFLNQLPLPNTHFLDMAAEHLEPVDIDEDVESPSSERAKFEFCESCGNHGTVYNHEGVPHIESIVGKQQGVRVVRELVESEFIRLEDRDRVINQILDSPLPEKSEEETEAEEAPRAGFSADDEDDDLGPVLVVCGACQGHANISFHDGRSQVKTGEFGSKKEGRESVNRLFLEGFIDAVEASALEEAIADTGFPEEETEENRGVRIMEVLGRIFGALDREGRQSKRLQ